jgi:membrane-associated phospholipid phosphatase
MAVSRPYVGVHYPSDVVAGALLGTAVAELAA